MKVKTNLLRATNIIILPTDKNFRYLAAMGIKVVHKPKELLNLNPTKTEVKDYA